VAFFGASVTFAALFLAAGAPTPLLVLFEMDWGFSSWMLTIAFAAYSVGLIAALLVVGSLSDFLGRRPVLVASLIVELAAMVMFIFAPDIGWVVAARLVQGVATGAATSAFSAAVVELAPVRMKKLGAIMGSTAPAGGLALGALLTGLAVQLSSHASLVVFTALAVLMIIGIASAVFSSETASRRPGARRSLVPRIAVPRLARSEFASAVPVIIGSWMLAGLFMGLVPTIVLNVFHIDSGFVNGATAFIEPGTAAVAGLAVGRVSSRRTLLVGGIAVFVGTAVIVAGIALVIFPLLVVGGLIGGLGFGASLSGSLRALGPMVQAHERAGLFAAVFLVAYVAFGIPAIIAGLLIVPLGLATTVIGYAVVILLATVVGVFAQSRATNRRA
jgi:MFS family permease